MAKILYTIATTEKGELISANDAPKGPKYFCSQCSTEVLLRKSGNNLKNSKRPHFAHKTLTPNCTPETALHFLFKNFLFQNIKQNIQKNTPLDFSWMCEYCDEKHSGNLLKKTKDVKLEWHLTTCQPDIALFDKENKVFAVIEVVVTHKPEKNVIQYYKENDIILIQIDLTSDADLTEIDKKISLPTKVYTCFNPKCKTCRGFQRKTKLTIVDGSCWKCAEPMKVAIKSEYYTNSGPQEFDANELEIARQNGAVIKMHYSKTVRGSYLANTCTHCGSFAGDHYLFTEYLAPASYGSLPSVQFHSGYHCGYCIQMQE